MLRTRKRNDERWFDHWLFRKGGHWLGLVLLESTRFSNSCIDTRLWSQTLSESLPQ